MGIMTTRVDPRDFIMSHKRGEVITIQDVEDKCGVSRDAAIKALCLAFGEKKVQPLWRRFGSDTWNVHFMAISRINGSDTEGEVAFLKT